MNHAYLITRQLAVHETCHASSLAGNSSTPLSMSRTSPSFSTNRLSISDKYAETKFLSDELSAQASGTPRFATSSPSVLEKKKMSITSDRSFSSGTFPYRRAQHDIPNDRGTKIIIVFPGFPFVCTLRFPVRFFVTPRLNPYREGRKGLEEFATKSL